MGRKKKNKTYYGPEQEEAVVRFLEAESDYERQKIYREELRAPIDKLIEKNPQIEVEELVKQALKQL